MCAAAVLDIPAHNEKCSVTLYNASYGEKEMKKDNVFTVQLINSAIKQYEESISLVEQVEKSLGDEEKELKYIKKQMQIALVSLKDWLDN